MRKIKSSDKIIDKIHLKRFESFSCTVTRKQDFYLICSHYRWREVQIKICDLCEILLIVSIRTEIRLSFFITFCALISLDQFPKWQTQNTHTYMHTPEPHSWPNPHTERMTERERERDMHVRIFQFWEPVRC